LELELASESARVSAKASSVDVLIDLGVLNGSVDSGVSVNDVKEGRGLGSVVSILVVGEVFWEGEDADASRSCMRVSEAAEPLWFWRIAEMVRARYKAILLHTWT